MFLTCRDNIIHNQDLLSGLDGVLLHLEIIRAIFLLISCGHTGTRQLALLANSNEARVELQGQRRTEQEASGIQADNDIGLDLVIGTAKLKKLQLERSQQSCVDGRVQEPWHNIKKVDARNGEVAEAPQSLGQAYLCTGEFGGGGGGGGGLSSRGMVGGVGLGGSTTTAGGGGGGGGSSRCCGLFWVGGQVALRVGGEGHVGKEKKEEGGLEVVERRGRYLREKCWRRHQAEGWEEGCVCRKKDWVCVGSTNNVESKTGGMMGEGVHKARLG